MEEVQETVVFKEVGEILPLFYKQGLEVFDQCAVVGNKVYVYTKYIKFDECNEIHNLVVSFIVKKVINTLMIIDIAYTRLSYHLVTGHPHGSSTSSLNKEGSFCLGELGKYTARNLPICEQDIKVWMLLLKNYLHTYNYEGAYYSWRNKDSSNKHAYLEINPITDLKDKKIKLLKLENNAYFIGENIRTTTIKTYRTADDLTRPVPVIKADNNIFRIDESQMNISFTLVGDLGSIIVNGKPSYFFNFVRYVEHSEISGKITQSRIDEQTMYAGNTEDFGIYEEGISAMFNVS